MFDDHWPPPRIIDNRVPCVHFKEATCEIWKLTVSKQEISFLQDFQVLSNCWTPLNSDLHPSTWVNTEGFHCTSNYNGFHIMHYIWTFFMFTFWIEVFTLSAAINPKRHLTSAESNIVLVLIMWKPHVKYKTCEGYLSWHIMYTSKGVTYTVHAHTCMSTWLLAWMQVPTKTNYVHRPFWRKWVSFFKH